MKKIILCLLAFVIISGSAQVVLAKSLVVSAPVKVAIKKYKAGNYTGCLQDCQRIVRYNPNDALAYYYMAMSYVHAGRKDEAIGAYSKVMGLSANERLINYAQTGKRCLETPDQCHQDSSTPELDRFIANPGTDGMSYTVRKDIEKKSLDSVRNQINNGKEMDSYNFRKFRDFSNQSSKSEETLKLASAKPTEKEIAAAVKVLQDAGLTYSPAQAQVQNQTQMQDVQQMQAAIQQNPEYVQLQALLGTGNTNNNNNNNAMLNMLPMMMMQNKDGTSNYSPQLMQAVIMNSMMTDFNFNIDDKNK